MTGDPLEAQGGVAGEGEDEEPNLPERLRQEIRRGDWESVRKRTDWNLQVIKWLVHQSRPCLRAKVSDVKLEAIGPVDKDRELDVLPFGACDVHSSTTGTKKGEDRSVSPYLDIRRVEGG